MGGKEGTREEEKKTKNGTKNEKCKLSFVSILARSFLQSGSHVGLVAGRESPGLSGVRSLLTTGSGLTLREALGLCAGGRGAGPPRGAAGARGLSLAGVAGGGCQGRGLPPAVGLARPVPVSVAVVVAAGGRGADVALALGPGPRSWPPVPLESLKQKRVGE